jgi:hypothetical protein
MASAGQPAADDRDEKDCSWAARQRWTQAGQGQARCGHVLQKALNPVSTEPVTVQVPSHGRKQSQDSGPVPQSLGTHSTG